jgi:ribosome-binding protein aMBF1 (putative translation factor)
MKSSKMKRLRAAGWKAGTAAEFLGLNATEASLVELKLALVAAVRAMRQKRGLSQTDLAQRLRSSQSRVAKIEAGDASVSLDLIVRALLAAGASRKDVQKAFVAIE